MKLGRIGEVGQEIPVLIEGERFLDLRSVIPDLAGDTLSPGSLDAVRAAAATGVLPEIEGAAERRIGSPIARPSAILCIGMNYIDHAAESGAAPPSAPILFLKTPNTLGGPHDPVRIPRDSARTDWEVELGIVIGTRAHELSSPVTARTHVAGFVTANDLSERDFQLVQSGGQWSKGKCAPGFTPLGPWLVTTDEIDPTGLALRSWVNGEPRQSSTTRRMIFDVDYLVWYLSQYLALEPGDLILTGTPEGVALSGRFPYLAAGDVVEVEVTGLGRQRQVMVQAETTRSRVGAR